MRSEQSFVIFDKVPSISTYYCSLIFLGLESYVSGIEHLPREKAFYRGEHEWDSEIMKPGDPLRVFPNYP